MNLAKHLDKFCILYFDKHWVSIFGSAPLKITPYSGIQAI